MTVMNKTVPFTHWRTIPFGDTDAARIVYTPKFSDYCMEAAEVWFREYINFDWYRINTELGIGTPVVHMDIDFLRPLKGGDKLGVVVTVDKIGRSSLTLTLKGIFEPKESNMLVPSFSARFIFCFTSIEAGGVISIPVQQREYIAAYCNQVTHEK